MSTKAYVFDGTVKWLKREPNVFKDGEGNETKAWTFLFYPKDRKAVAATGIKNKLKEDDDGFHYTLRSKEPFPIEGVDDNKLIGNGSYVSVKLVVEEFTSPKHGKVVRSSVGSVDVLDLVEYTAPATDESNPLPA